MWIPGCLSTICGKILFTHWMSWGPFQKSYLQGLRRDHKLIYSYSWLSIIYIVFCQYQCWLPQLSSKFLNDKVVTVSPPPCQLCNSFSKLLDYSKLPPTIATLSRSVPGSFNTLSTAVRHTLKMKNSCPWLTFVFSTRNTKTEVMSGYCATEWMWEDNQC